MLYYEELLGLFTLIAGIFGLYIFMKYRDKGYKDDNGEFIVLPHRHKD